MYSWQLVVMKQWDVIVSDDFVTEFTAKSDGDKCLKINAD